MIINVNDKIKKNILANKESILLSQMEEYSRLKEIYKFLFKSNSDVFYELSDDFIANEKYIIQFTDNIRNEWMTYCFNHSLLSSYKSSVHNVTKLTPNNAFEVLFDYERIIDSVKFRECMKREEQFQIITRSCMSAINILFKFLSRLSNRFTNIFCFVGYYETVKFLSGEINFNIHIEDTNVVPSSLELYDVFLLNQ